MFLIFKIKTDDDKISVIKLAIIIGYSQSNIQYKNQQNTHIVNNIYIKRDIHLVFFVTNIFITCGTKDMVVKTAALYHNKLIVSMNYNLKFLIKQLLCKIIISSIAKQNREMCKSIHSKISPLQSRTQNLLLSDTIK